MSRSLPNVNERTTYTISVSFVDEDGVPAIPTAATCRIDDEESETNLRAEAAITPLDSTVEIVVAETEMGIVNRHREYEIHVFTVEWDYGIDDRHGTAELRFKVKNLLGVDHA